MINNFLSKSIFRVPVRNKIVDAAVARQFLHTGGVSSLDCTVDTYCGVDDS